VQIALVLGPAKASFLGEAFGFAEEPGTIHN